MAALRYDDKVALIQEVKNHPVIWQGEHEKYGDRFSTLVAWKAIARKLEISDNILKAKWKSLRDIYRNIIRKTGISSLEEYNGKWKYFHLMAFIKNEYKDDDDSVEFIVETDSGGENSDNESQVSFSTYSNNNHESELFTQNNTTDEESSKSNCNDRLKNDKNETQSVNDEEIIRYIDRRENDHQTYSGKPEYTDNTDSESKDDEVPTKRQKTSDAHSNYDVMFLRSLAPYFKQLDPLRKLVMRSRIQDLLLNEIAEQKSLKYDT